MLPLRFARLGAGAQVGFTVFVAAATGVAAAVPWETLTIDKLDEKLLASTGYDAALLEAARVHAHQIFVAEHRTPVATLTAAGGLGPKLRQLTGAEQTLTRLSTRLPANELKKDVEFTAPTSDNVPTQRYVSATVASADRRGPPGSGARPGGTSAFLVLTSTSLLAAVLVRARPKEKRSPD